MKYKGEACARKKKVMKGKSSMRTNIVHEEKKNPIALF
jgi:hypothetical protein